MPAVAGYDPNPSDNLRIEVAFTTGPDDPDPAYVDLTDRLDLSAGVSITRGRNDEFSAVQPSSMSCTLDNADGALTAGNAGSVFYPDVRPHRKVRVSYRNPDVGGNFLDAESASFEGGTLGSWTALGAGSASVDTVHATHGLRAMRIDWAVTASPSGRRVVVSGLTIGRDYTLSADMFVPTGGEPVSLNINGIGLGVATSTTNAIQRVSTAFTATATSHTINVYQLSVTTAYSSWVDAIRVDEGSGTDFTLDAPPIQYRFTGYVEEWPVEWPNGGTYSQAQISAVDGLARIGAKRPMRSVIEETVLALSPWAYYPLGEPENSTMAGETSGRGGSPLSTKQYGSGGTLEFGTATGPPTDSLPAPTFTPLSASNGVALTGPLQNLGSRGVVGGIFSAVLGGCFLTSSTSAQTIARVDDVFASSLRLGTNAFGKATLVEWDVWSGAAVTSLASSGSVNDGATHSIYGVQNNSGGTITTTLYVDGVSVASASRAGSFLPAYTSVTIGGRDGAMFSGTISHVAAFHANLTAAQVAEIHTATTTGYEGDTSDERIARYASWAGVTEVALDAGLSESICFTETTGLSVLQAMQDVALTESGRLFMDGAGVLTFHSRSRLYAAAPAVASLDAHMVGQGARFVMSTQGLVNDASGQRPNGPVVRAFDQPSIDEYGVSAASLTVLLTLDTEVADAVNWRVNTNSTPHVAMPQTELDAYTDTTGYQAQIRALELGDRLTITGLPATAPESTVDLVVEGYTETISLTGWTVSANTSNYTAVRAWVWDESEWDDGSRWIY